MNKMEHTKQWLAGHGSLLRCPLCTAPVMLTGNSLLCAQRHCYDIARQGYVNLLNGHPDTGYDRSLFEARRAVCAAGFFDPLLEELAGQIAAACGDAPVLLDAGCGEGSHLAGVADRLVRLGKMLAAIGADIAKEGVRAASAYSDALWAVADIARLPVADSEVDALLNILSPSNYTEFGRVLKPEGVLLKVLPGSGYLKELRHAVGKGGEEYTNQPVAERFMERFLQTGSRRVTYTITLEREMLQNLARMTPLGWGADQAGLQEFLAQERAAITVEFLVLTGRKQP